MRVLVTVASRHGATLEIAESIAATLTSHGVAAVVRPPAAVVDLSPYDAVIVGSAVYAGQWLREAVSFLSTHRDELAARPLWLFSSGPVGSPPRPASDPALDQRLRALSRPAGHEVFAGRLEPSLLNWRERAVVRALRAPSGDFRDWDAVHAWARGIALHLDHAGGATPVA